MRNFYCLDLALTQCREIRDVLKLERLHNVSTFDIIAEVDLHLDIDRAPACFLALKPFTRIVTRLRVFRDNLTEAVRIARWQSELDTLYDVLSLGSE